MKEFRIKEYSDDVKKVIQESIDKWYDEKNKATMQEIMQVAFNMPLEYGFLLGEKILTNAQIIEPHNLLFTKACMNTTTELLNATYVFEKHVLDMAKTTEEPLNKKQKDGVVAVCKVLYEITSAYRLNGPSIEANNPRGFKALYSKFTDCEDAEIREYLDVICETDVKYAMDKCKFLKNGVIYEKNESLIKSILNNVSFSEKSDNLTQFGLAIKAYEASPKKAVKAWTFASKKDSEIIRNEANYLLAYAYANGYGVEQDEEKAKALINELTPNHPSSYTYENLNRYVDEATKVYLFAKN